jgi:hypothetical protein
MNSRAPGRRCTAVAAAALAATALTSLPAGVAHAATTGFHGVNWADPRDNFADDAVVPSGLSTSDTYATTKAKAVPRWRSTRATAAATRVGH